ncbi:MAG TPA: hypothetical protein QF564_23035 [Pirellulaceae bacterium]|nr:hypothetical protein [Pirellulaceae bacterium]
MSQAEISITGEPISDAMCRFTVDRPVYPDRSFAVLSKEAAEGSPLAQRLTTFSTTLEREEAQMKTDLMIVSLLVVFGMNASIARAEHVDPMNRPTMSDQTMPHFRRCSKVRLVTDLGRILRNSMLQIRFL